MQLFILFGLPGAGKTYVGTVFEKDFGFFMYDGDNELPKDMDIAIQTQAVVTDEMRDRFFKKIISRIHLLQKNHPLVITQTFLKEKYRAWVLDEISDVQFVLIQTRTSIREARLTARTEYPLDVEYARKMVQNFEEPQIPHFVIDNNQEGSEHIKEQVQGLLLRLRLDSNDV